MSLFLMAGCRKDDNAKIPDIVKIPLPLLTKDRTASLTISAETPDAFSAKFKLALFYPTGEKPSKFDVVIRKNESNASAKVFKTDVTTFPSDITLTGVQLRELFGPVSLGDIYDVGANVTTTDGKQYLAFPTTGRAYGTNIANVAGVSPTVRYEAVCPFKMADYGAIGSTVPYIVDADGWNDYPKGTTIPVTIIDATHLSFFYPTDVDPKPIVITINPQDNSTSVDKVAFGGYGDPLIYSAESISNSVSNAAYPCKLTVSVNLAFSSSAGNYPPGVITLRKK